MIIVNAAQELKAAKQQNANLQQQQAALSLQLSSNLQVKHTKSSLWQALLV